MTRWDSDLRLQGMDCLQRIATPERASIVFLNLKELHLEMVEKCYSVHQVFWMKVMSLILEAAYSVEEVSQQFLEVASFLPHSNLVINYLPRQEQEVVSELEGVQGPKV